jgi:manganese/iron transport system ATP-binding protein/manganese/zinc/iron transport system ATP- binding protein
VSDPAAHPAGAERAASTVEDPAVLGAVPASLCAHARDSRADGRPLVELEDAATGYGPDLRLREVTLTATAGQRVAVLGPNGGGKTTLFRLLLGELPLRGGRLALHDDVAVVPQTERSRLDFPVSALDVVLMGTIARRPWWRGPRREDREQALAALEVVGLTDRAGAAFGALSGGQRQRVLVARALVRDARILLLDEPFTGLDTTSGDRLHQLIDRLADAGHLLLIATHDVRQAQGWDRVLCLNGRQVAYGAPAETLSVETLEATYGRDLLRLDDGRTVRLLGDHHHH